MIGDKRIGLVTGSAEADALAARLPHVVTFAPDALREEDTPSAANAAKIPCALSERALTEAGLGALIVAPHPFDARAFTQAVRLARKAALPYCMLCRDGYRQRPGDRWVRLVDVGQAAQLIPADARVFATTGAADLAALRPLRARLFIRRRAEPPARCPLPQGIFVPSRGPFTVAQEMRLMRRLGIDWLITRDAGGAGSYPKLVAARRLGIRVALITRPRLPAGLRVRRTKEAMEWLLKVGS